MLETKEGYSFISRYMSKGQTLSIGGKIYTFKSTGDRSKDVLWLRSSKNMRNRQGLTRAFTKDMKKELRNVNASVSLKKGVNQVIDLNNKMDSEKATMVLGHEAFVHADKNVDALNDIDNKVSKGGYKNLVDYIIDIVNVSTGGDKDHEALGEDKVIKYKNYSTELSSKNKNLYYLKEYKKEVSDEKKK